MGSLELNANDILEITNLIHNYFQYIDFNNPCKFAYELFSSSPTFSFPYRKIHLYSREDLEKLCKSLHEKFPTTTHWEGNIVIENTSTKEIKSATNSSYWKAIREGVIISNGFHFDKFEQQQDGKWVFQERGRLRASKLTHHAVGSSIINPRSYRIKDEIEFSLLIEEYDGSKQAWVPFTSNDVQLEFTMIDPYIRLNLAHNGAGIYSVKFTLPDVYGVFKFVINYHRLGYTNLELSEQVSVHPFRHNDYERFIVAAYPYYASAFSMMAGFFLFGIVYLYTRDDKAHIE